MSFLIKTINKCLRGVFLRCPTKVPWMRPSYLWAFRRVVGSPRVSGAVKRRVIDEVGWGWRGFAREVKLRDGFHMIVSPVDIIQGRILLYAHATPWGWA